mgnify:CR=1 FL=1
MGAQYALIVGVRPPFAATLSVMGKASRRKKINSVKAKQYRPPIPFVERPFEGIVGERELVAMKELIPCATFNAKTNEKYGSVDFDIVTLLPDGAPSMVRADGRVLVGLQTRFHSGDISHDLGGALLAAIALQESGEDGVAAFDVRDPAPRLQDILDDAHLVKTAPKGAVADMEITDDFSFWFDPNEERDDATEQALAQNREDMVPTEEVPGATGMYWCEMNNNFVRYVTDVDEDALFTALARLQVAGDSTLGEGSKFVGAFRACGLAIPVYQVDASLTAEDLAKPGRRLENALEEALKEKSPLTEDEKRARRGLVSRQVTIR